MSSHFYLFAVSTAGK